MSKSQHSTGRGAGHFPSDKFFGNPDDGTKKLFEQGSYLGDEGTIDVHNYGLFDEDSCAAGEKWDLGDGIVFEDRNNVDEISFDDLTIVSDSAILFKGNRADPDSPNDAADQWLAEHDQ